VITTQVALLTLIHGQPSCVVSVTLPAPPLTSNGGAAIPSVYVQAACVIL